MIALFRQNGDQRSPYAQLACQNHTIWKGLQYANVNIHNKMAELICSGSHTVQLIRSTSTAHIFM